MRIHRRALSADDIMICGPHPDVLIALKESDFKGDRVYESFTHEDEDEANFLATEYRRNKKRKKNKGNLTVSEAMDAYIEARDGMRSPGTIRGYKKIKRNHFPDLMYVKVKDITIDDLQVALNEEYKRPSRKYKEKKQPLAPKKNGCKRIQLPVCRAAGLWCRP